MDARTQEAMSGIHSSYEYPSGDEVIPKNIGKINKKPTIKT